MGIDKFTGVVKVHLYGEKALNYLGDSNGVAYFIIRGFTEDLIIEDHRNGIIQSIQKYQQTKIPSAFLKVFNQPAFINIKEFDDGKVVIILENVDIDNPTEYLWIAVGIEDEIPAYNYLLWQIVPLNENQYSILAVFTVKLNFDARSNLQFSPMVDHE